MVKIARAEMTTRERDYGKMERARRVVMAVISVVTIWASSLRSASAATNARRGERDESFENAVRAWRAVRDEMMTQRMMYDACVRRSRDGHARVVESARARYEARANATAAANDSTRRRLKRKVRRCERAVDALARALRPVYARRGSAFWTESCANLSATVDPKRIVLVGMNETGEAESRARLQASSAVYEGRVQTSVEHLLRQIDARSTYDAEYVRNATTSLRESARAAQLYAESRYDAMRNSSVRAIRRLNDTSSAALNTVSQAAESAVENMREIIEETALGQSFEQFAIDSGKLAEYVEDIDANLDDIRAWLKGAERVIEIAEDAGGGFAVADVPTVLNLPAPNFPAPSFDFPNVTSPFDDVDDAARRAANAVRESASNALESALKPFNDTVSFDLSVDLELGTLLTDYDPPPFATASGETTNDVDAFAMNTARVIRESFENFTGALSNTFASTSNVTGLVFNRTVSAATTLSTSNATPVDFVPETDTFDGFDALFRAVPIPNIFAFAEFAFIGLVNIDLTYRIIRCVTVTAKHLAYGALDFHPINLLDAECDAKRKKLSAYERFGRFFADPIVIAIVRCAVFIAVTMATLGVYRRAYASYVSACVARREPTLLGEYGFTLARAFVDTTPRALASTYATRAAYVTSRACERARLVAVDAFHRVDADRHSAELDLDAVISSLRATSRCVDALDDVSKTSIETFRARARALDACAPESFALDASAAASPPPECERTPRASTLTRACVGPIDPLLAARAEETSCALERVLHARARRVALLALAYVSMNIAREPFVESLGRLSALCRRVDVVDVPVVARYDARGGRVRARRDASSRVREALRGERARRCAVVVACAACQIPWASLAAKTRE